MGTDDHHRAEALAAGFDVRVPALSRRKPSPALRLDTVASDPSVVGAHQLAQVRWSAVFDDVELTAAEISQLASQARPLIRSHGKWVELDRADLAEAAAALAERSTQTQLTGAEVLRFAIGLEESPLAGGFSVGGSGWAADLLASAEEMSAEPITSPEGFSGELRSYQGEAVAWLGFLDSVELGGCLALDMGLGKTPTMLAHIARTAGDGPALVIAPPAVVGNWAAEAARFTPGLRVVVHHGASRASEQELGIGGGRRGHRHHDLRHRGARRRGDLVAERGTVWCWTRRRPSRTRPARPLSSCDASLPGSASR